MASALKLGIMISCLASYFFACNCQMKGKEDQGFKGMFVFGSSIVDNGNNNFLKTMAKANYNPYGIDFPGGASGRFSNGKNMVDFLAQKLKLPGFIPPFADPSTKGYNITHGVNFASGGSGILDDTGSSVGHVFSLNEQMNNFEKVTVPELEAQLGRKSTESLPNYLFVFGAGGNDYTFNYFMPRSNVNVNDVAFASNLTNLLSQHIKRLYGLGGRKFMLLSIYPIGCTPMAKLFGPLQLGCLEDLNRAVRLFNFCLNSMVDLVKHELPGSSFVVVDQYKIISDILQDPEAHGFKETRRACCARSPLLAGANRIACMKDGRLCADRRAYVYFDGLHPTEAVNARLSNNAFDYLV